jgi:hypothetical protein
METVFITPMSRREAAPWLKPHVGLDPTGRSAQNDFDGLSGQHYQAKHQATGKICIYSVDEKNGVAWVNSMAGESAEKLDFFSLIEPIIRVQYSHCESIRFQTMRRGLVKKAEKKGYQVSGWILKKNLEKNSKNEIL